MTAFSVPKYPRRRHQFCPRAMNVQEQRNPYVALACAIGSGLWGIENKIEPDAAIEGNAYEKKFPKSRALPRTLYEAAERLEASKPARALFGDAFVEHYAATRKWEEREFRKAITDWEMARYFEII